MPVQPPLHFPGADGALGSALKLHLPEEGGNSPVVVLAPFALEGMAVTLGTLELDAEEQLGGRAGDDVRLGIAATITVEDEVDALRSFA